MILLNDFKRQWSETGAGVLEAVERVGASGWYILGPEVERFEKSLAEFWGCRFAIGTANGLDAIEIALLAAGISPGDKVLTTPLSAYATTLAIQKCGAVPVFVDVDASGLLDLELAERALRADRSIRYLVPVHLYGHCLDLDRLARIRADLGVTVIEDCAQSISAAWGNRRAGTIGQAAATSFYPTKNLGALGDGGALLTDDPALAEKARALRNYGQSRKYVHDWVGLNSRLDELHAAILSDFLRRLPGWTRRRQETARRFYDGLKNARLQPIVPHADSVSAHHLLPVLVSDAGERDAFMKHLSGAGVQSAIHYPVIIPDQRALAEGNHAEIGAMTNARSIASKEVSLPIHPYLAPEEIDRMVAACNGW